MPDRVARRVAMRAPRRLPGRLMLGAVLCFGAAPALALYDPQPAATLAVVEGAWTGTLTCRDYREPDRLVTLPTRVSVALATPDTLVLHYVFDDGPGKTVHSYERMRFDAAAGEVRWVAGDADRHERVYRIVSSDRGDDGQRIVFEAGAGDSNEAPVQRFTAHFDGQRWMLRKEEIDAAGQALLRNTFLLTRPLPSGR